MRTSRVLLDMKSKLDVLITATLVVCALTTTGVLLHREMLSPTAPLARLDQKPVLIPSWRDELAAGVRIGPVGAPVQLIEFADFECPYCGSFHKMLKVVRERFPDQVSLVYVHFPLAMHRFAMLAARLAECAADQGRFAAMYDQLFEGQDQLGLKPWNDYAVAAGVPDITAFDACIKKTDPIPRVEEGKALGAKFDVQGTPTVIINGWKLGHPPTAEQLEQMVRRILAGNEPIDGKS